MIFNEKFIRALEEDPEAAWSIMSAIRGPDVRVAGGDEFNLFKNRVTMVIRRWLVSELPPTCSVAGSAISYGLVTKERMQVALNFALIQRSNNYRDMFVNTNRSHVVIHGIEAIKAIAKLEKWNLDYDARVR